jgi:hypothetical protein
MGKFAVRTALDFDLVDQIVIADKNADRAKNFDDECGPKASFAILVNLHRRRHKNGRFSEKVRFSKTGGHVG